MHYLYLMGYDARNPRGEAIRSWLYETYCLYPKNRGQIGWYSNCELTMRQLVALILYIPY